MRIQRGRWRWQTGGNAPDRRGAANVVLIPGGQTDQNGSHTSRALPPGKYRVLATTQAIRWDVPEDAAGSVPGQRDGTGSQGPATDHAGAGAALVRFHNELWPKFKHRIPDRCTPIVDKNGHPENDFFDGFALLPSCFQTRDTEALREDLAGSLSPFIRMSAEPL
jgi:hypothetical protein